MLVYCFLKYKRISLITITNESNVFNSIVTAVSHAAFTTWNCASQDEIAFPCQHIAHKQFALYQMWITIHIITPELVDSWIHQILLLLLLATFVYARIIPVQCSQAFSSAANVTSKPWATNILHMRSLCKCPK